MIQFNKQPGQRVLELGGGSNRNPQTDVCVDIRPGPGIDFTADFSQPLPISSDEFDAIISIFCLEHLPYPNVPPFLSEVLRVLKPGGRAVFLVPNTEKQIQWILAHPDGWDGKGLFESASCKLFGDQEHGKRLGAEDAGVDSHKAYFNPAIALELFNAAGFEGVITAPFGERATDMIVEAVKPVVVVGMELSTGTIMVNTEPNRVMPLEPMRDKEGEEVKLLGLPVKIDPTLDVPKEIVLANPITKPAAPYEPAKLFNRQYFDFGGLGYPHGYMDFPQNELIARHVLARKPQSVLELGCGRGYLLKKVQRARIGFAQGMDISRHAYLTRVCEGILTADATQKWPFDNQAAGVPIDLCFSVAFFEHVPEELLPKIFFEMQRVTKRGLHGISFVGNGHDTTQINLKPRSWWVERMPVGHEVIGVDELRAGKLPPEHFRSVGDAVKLNVGSYLSMTHHGWFNLDLHDLSKFAQANGFNFQQRDIRQGFIQQTGTVDAIVLHHVLEHFDAKEAVTIVRELRRVIKPNGGLRIIVPDMNAYIEAYQAKRLGEFDEMNGGSAEQATQAGKFHALLYGGDHKMAYDVETLLRVLAEAGFRAKESRFCHAAFENVNLELILSETNEHDYGGTSLFVDAVPLLG